MDSMDFNLDHGRSIFDVNSLRVQPSFGCQTMFAAISALSFESSCKENSHYTLEKL